MIDKKYKKLLEKIIDNGKVRGDRTGTGTLSIFSGQIEHDMSKGFPLLTTKKMFTKGIIYELLWFLNGDTNIRYLVKNGVNIWTPDAFREYKKKYKKSYEELSDNLVIDVQPYKEPLIEDFKKLIINNDKFAELHGELGPIYGKQWVSWDLKQKESVNTGEVYPSGEYKVDFKYKSINQIQQVIDKLNNKPEDRRIMVSAWNVAEIDEMALPPCHYGFELYTEELTLRERINTFNKTTKEPIQLSDLVGHFGINVEDEMTSFLNEKLVPTRKLSLKWHQRSVDSFLGLPFNIASYGILLEMFAQQTNMVAGKLIGDLTNVHIYNNHIEQCEEQLTREGYNLPKLRLNKAKDIFSYSYDDFSIEDYIHHPPIKGNISV